MIGPACLVLAATLQLGPPDPAAAERYNEAGTDLLVALSKLDPARLGSWTVGPPEAVGDVTRARWAEGGSERGRAGGVVKLVSLDAVTADAVEATVRYERTTGHRVERGRFSTRWRTAPLTLASVRLLSGETVDGPGDRFVDRARERGLAFVGQTDPRFVPPSDALRFQIIRHASGGASAADVDGDGWDDVLLTRGTDARLFQNRGDGTFADRTEAVGLGGIQHATHAVFADFDADGDTDLFVGRFYGQNLLFENTGGRFVDRTGASGLASDDATTAVVAEDLNGDGHLDLYLGRFLDARTQVPTMIHYSRNGLWNRLYLGGGDLTFRDVSTGSGADDTGLTLGIAAGDTDADGDTDLYLANDFGRNVLLQNQGDGTFVDVAKEAGALAISAGMSASFGDYDGDGDPDLYVSSIRSNQRWFSTATNLKGYIVSIVQTNRRAALQPLFLDLRRHLGDRWDQLGQDALAGNVLLQNQGDGTFRDVSDAASARPFGWYWASGFHDVDRDGRLDILAVNGWITGPDKHDL